MRTLVSGMNKQLLVRLIGRKPTQIAATEAGWPPRHQTMRADPAPPFTDDDATLVLEAWRTQGISEQTATLTFEEALLDAKSQRMAWLDYFVNAFREENARRRADNQ